LTHAQRLFFRLAVVIKREQPPLSKAQQHLSEPSFPPSAAAYTGIVVQQPFTALLVTSSTRHLHVGHGCNASRCIFKGGHGSGWQPTMHRQHCGRMLASRRPWVEALMPPSGAGARQACGPVWGRPTWAQSCPRGAPTH
jgi:hypothetical protein